MESKCNLQNNQLKYYQILNEVDGLAGVALVVNSESLGMRPAIRGAGVERRHQRILNETRRKMVALLDEILGAFVLV